MTMDVYPKARDKRLVVQELENETLVYDLDTNRAFCLNEMATNVWRKCDGSRNKTDIAGSIKNADGEIGRQAVSYAIDLLDSNGLLEDSSSIEIPTATRRDAIKKLAIGGVALLPVISMIVAPQPAHAASCVANDGACSASAQCCSNCCKNVGGGINACKPGGGACLP
jgi:hypothetical protein